MVKDSTMYELISGDNLQASVENLYNTAMENGGVDNITNILIQITESPHMSSSFRNFNPVKTMPRNSDYEATGQVTIDAEDYQSHKKNSKTKYLIYGLVGSLVIATGLYFLFRGKEEVPIDKTPGGVKVREIKITKAELEKKSEEDLDKIEKNITNGSEIYICSDCSEGKIKNDKFSISLDPSKKIKALTKNSPDGVPGDGVPGDGGKGGNGDKGGKGGNGGKGGEVVRTDSETKDEKTVTIKVGTDETTARDLLKKHYKYVCNTLDSYDEKGYEKAQWKINKKVWLWTNLKVQAGEYTCTCNK
jgi:hypothetical protein